jgi:hypothetical protein
MTSASTPAVALTGGEGDASFADAIAPPATTDRKITHVITRLDLGLVTRTPPDRPRSFRHDS